MAIYVCSHFPKCLHPEALFSQILEDLPTHNYLSWGYNTTLHKTFIHVSCEFTLHSHLKVSSDIISTGPVQNGPHSVW